MSQDGRLGPVEAERHMPTTVAEREIGLHLFLIDFGG
jgi:hypothetical protein